MWLQVRMECGPANKICVTSKKRPKKAISLQENCGFADASVIIISTNVIAFCPTQKGVMGSDMV
jgi:hypothetical protein